MELSEKNIRWSRKENFENFHKKTDRFLITCKIFCVFKACAKVYPKALIGIISNPENSFVPMVAEVFKQAGVYDYNRIFSVTTLDIVRFNPFITEYQGLSLPNRI